MISLQHIAMFEVQAIVKRFLKTLCISWMVITGVSHPAHSQSQLVYGGLDLLYQAPHASMLSVGEAHGVLNNGSAAAFSNPASALLTEYNRVDLSYGFWIGNIGNSYAGVVFNKPNRIFGLALYSSGSDQLEARIQPGPSMGSFNARTLALSGLYGVRIGNFSMAASLLYLNEEIFQYQANGYAFSAGMVWKHRDDRYRFGLSLEHAGKMESLDQSETLLPTRIRLSGSALLVTASIGTLDDYQLSLRSTFDIVQPVSVTESRSIKTIFQGLSLSSGDPFKETAFIHTGWILSINELIKIKTGYTFGETSRPVSAGLELELLDLNFSYSLIPFKTNYGTAHAVGLQIPL